MKAHVYVLASVHSSHIIAFQMDRPAQVQDATNNPFDSLSLPRRAGVGKTHTMGSAPSHGVGESDEEGIIPRAVRHIFHLMRTDHASKVINVKVMA